MLSAARTMTRARVLLALAMATTGVGMTSVANAPGAAAAVSCSGTVTYSKTHSSGQAQLVVYYNSSNGGTNSACMYHRGAMAGVTSVTVVQIARCTNSRPNADGNCTDTDMYKFDEGKFAQYAGPAGVTGTANRCVTAGGYLELRNGSTVTINTKAIGC